jgi:hypothetical protein
MHMSRERDTGVRTGSATIAATNGFFPVVAIGRQKFPDATRGRRVMSWPRTAAGRGGRCMEAVVS